jgi:hypothetical protein
MDRDNSVLVKSAPPAICLCISDDEAHYDEPFPRDFGEELTWSSDKPVECTVSYVRSDLSAGDKLIQELLNLAREVDDMRRDNEGEVGYLKGENARLKAAHDHQHAVAGTLLREAEREGRKYKTLKNALAYIEARLDSVVLPSGQPQLSRAVTDIRRVMIEALADTGRM